jgi:16S rRNA (guanine527-N7)-methyltransferase
MASADTLSAALARHEIELTDEQIALLQRYAARLWEVNEQLNLTRHTDFEKFVSRDVVDSRWLESFLEPAERVLDVGTGGGVPGIVLAILRPDLEVALCDSVAKKAKAVSGFVTDLGLKIPVYHAAAQDVIQQYRRFDALVIRAVAPLQKLLTWFEPHWDRFGRLLLVKGPAWVEERAAARERRLLHGLRLSKLARYPLPGTESESVVLQIRPADSTGGE